MDGCIIWTGNVWAKGRYGMDTINGKVMGAHRAAWIRVNGPIPKGLVACHKCDNGLCVNVEHLFLGTLKDNMQDCSRKGRIKYADQRGANNHNARPDYYLIRDRAKEMKVQNFTTREIRKALNIKSNGHLYQLLRS